MRILKGFYRCSATRSRVFVDRLRRASPQARPHSAAPTLKAKAWNPAEQSLPLTPLCCVVLLTTAPGQR